MRIRFTADAIYETEGRGRGPRYVAGEAHDLRDGLAKRRVRRNVAVEAPSEALNPVMDIGAGGGTVEVPPAEPPPAAPAYRMQHAGGGRWHIVSADGERMTEAPLPKAEAETRLAELAA